MLIGKGADVNKQDKEGYPEIAQMYRAISIAEKEHESRYKAFVKNIEADEVFEKTSETTWICRNCGYVHTGKEAPNECPACRHPKAYFEVKKDNY